MVMLSKREVLYGATEILHIFREKQTQFPEKVNYWAGILENIYGWASVTQCLINQ